MVPDAHRDRLPAPGMPRYQQVSQLVGVALPFLGLPAAIWLFWGRGVSTVDLALLASLYVLTGLGIGVGYHRLLTHRAFQTYRGLRYMWAILGSLALQGSVLPWVAHHRKHHAYADVEAILTHHTDTAEDFVASSRASRTPTSAGCCSEPARATAIATWAT